ncbi:S-adenosylmethionine--2-demethylmenaquinone methyltransferase [Acidocella aquatica]|uniref:Putative 4-hydroxy-4-methyl-2-oxoglutarate aldolase n=1 Tax=Acidocella aquatica TaxID=1922313 RepID=A0ABQ6A6P5_9PROT|nr:4-carboxy-4-hydroxy-2-oxoadipate aldolase/oxaloacetate decarboxylase [Acidocella aquatica]GLR66975.1 S-adenosylmethionine--2-demethylmenaquinone methyltransferase [Acidocella aquatica]
MKHHNAGLTTQRKITRVDAQTVAAAATLPTATIHEAAGKIGALPCAIKPVANTFRLCGPALTVHSPPGDNLWLHRAMDIAQPGDIMVVYASGGYDYGYWGEIMSTAAKVKKLGGLVIDGCVRDAGLLEEIGFPVFARGLCIRGTLKDYGAVGWLNAPVYIGEIVISGGDLVVGDRDGVVALPRERAAELVAKAQARELEEADVLKRIEAGATTLEIYNFN